MVLSVEELIKDYSVRLDGLKAAINTKEAETKAAAKKAKANGENPWNTIKYIRSFDKLFALRKQVLDIHEFIEHLKNRRW
jgi:hypothetical protein